MHNFASAASVQHMMVCAKGAKGQPLIVSCLQSVNKTDIRFTQNHHLTAAISDWAHAEGFPFDVAELSSF